jgi:hypothetical protein
VISPPCSKQTHRRGLVRKRQNQDSCSSPYPSPVTKTIVIPNRAETRGELALSEAEGNPLPSTDGNAPEAYICRMSRQLSHLLGTIGMLITMLLWLSLLNPPKADRFVDHLAGSQYEYKIVLCAAMLSAVFSFIAAVRGSKWWYVGVAFSSATLAFFTYTLSV